MLDRLKLIESRYLEINDKLLEPEIVKDVKKLTSLMKERSSLEKIVEVYKEYQSLLDQVQELKILKNDENEEIDASLLEKFQQSLTNTISEWYNI